MDNANIHPLQLLLPGDHDVERLLATGCARTHTSTITLLRRHITVFPAMSSTSVVAARARAATAADTHARDTPHAGDPDAPIIITIPSVLSLMCRRVPASRPSVRCFPTSTSLDHLLTTFTAPCYMMFTTMAVSDPSPPLALSSIVLLVVSSMLMRTTPTLQLASSDQPRHSTCGGFPGHCPCQCRPGSSTVLQTPTPAQTSPAMLAVNGLMALTPAPAPPITASPRHQHCRPPHPRSIPSPTAHNRPHSSSSLPSPLTLPPAHARRRGFCNPRSSPTPRTGLLQLDAPAPPRSPKPD